MLICNKTANLFYRRVPGIANVLSQHSLAFKRFHENVAFYTKQDFLTISLACLTISLSLQLMNEAEYLMKNYGIARVFG